MSNFDRHLLLCDPLPEGESTISGWTHAIRGVERIILERQQPSPIEVAEVLAQIPVLGRLGSNPFSSSAAAVVSKALPDSSGCDSLVGSVCVMSAAIRVVAKRHLSANHKVSRRDSIALALWSALSYQRPLAEQRLEDVRAEMLNSARRTGVDLARRTRARRTLLDHQSPDDENQSLRWNAVLDREEIKVLRWTLADQSSLLQRPYAEVRSEEAVAVARGLELGLLLTKFPAFEHYELASRDVTPQHEMNLDELLAAVAEDRNALLAPFEGYPVIEACPTVFPLLTALRGGRTVPGDAAVGRSLADWCGRALIESAILRRSQSNMEGN